MLTAETVVDGRVPATPVVSPDGRWVAFVVTPFGRPGARDVGELWVVAVDGSTAPAPLAVPDGLPGAPRWSGDSGSVFFLAAGPSGPAQLHRVELDGATRVLTDWPNGIDGYRPLVDPDLVAVFAADPRIDEDDPVRRPPNPSRLRLLDLRTGRLDTPAVLADRHVVDVVQRPDGGPLAVLTLATPEIDPGLLAPELHLLDPDSGHTRDLGVVPAAAESPVWWRGEDWHLSYLALTPPGLQAGLAVFDLAGSDGRHRNLTTGLTACPAELVQVDTGPPLVLVADGLDTAIHRIDPAGPRLVEVARIDGQAERLSASRDGAVIAAILSRPDQPHDVYAGPVAGPLVRRSDTRPELRGIAWGAQQRLAYSAADGLALDGLLVLPPGRMRSDGPFPLVTIVHGGPYDRYADGFMLFWAPCAQWLALAGYAVFLPNPRGGQGHGHEFAAAVAGAVGQQEWTDVLTGIDLLVAEGVADPDRLGIAGWSHGGFLSAWAVGQTDRFAAALMGAGISDWGAQAGTGEWGAFEVALCGSVGWEGTGPHQHDRLSPISYAAAVRTPVLIVHGAEDTNVPLAQAEYFHRALRHFGVEHEFVVYPGEGHQLRGRRHLLDLMARTREWFDRWLT